MLAEALCDDDGGCGCGAVTVLASRQCNLLIVVKVAVSSTYDVAGGCLSTANGLSEPGNFLAHSGLPPGSPGAAMTP